MPINEAWYKNVSERICIYMKEKTYGVIQGALYQRGAGVIKRAKYLIIRYLYQKKVNSYK